MSIRVLFLSFFAFLIACGGEQSLIEEDNLNPSAIIEGPSGISYFAHHVIILPSPSVTRTTLEQRLSSFNAKIVEENSELSQRYGYLKVVLPENKLADEAIAALKESGVVSQADRNYLVQAVATPNDPSFNALWGMNKISAPGAWDLQEGSKTIIVAVSDTGVDYRHHDLADNMWINPNEIPDNGIDDDQNGYIDDIYGYDFYSNEGDPLDENKHGTHVAGTIGAVGNNSLGVAGVNWKVSIQAVRFLGPTGSGSSWNGAQTILYAANNGAKIVNASWGGGAATSYLYDAIATLRDKGGVFVAAAGNSNVDTDATPHYPSCYDLPNIVSVAASTSDDNRAYFSNYGKVSVDIAAPGYLITSTLPNNSYGSLSGTSMAAPHVAGALALALAENPSLGWSELVAKLYQSGDPLDLFSSITSTGKRLNVHQLIVSAADSDAPDPPTNLRISAGRSSDVQLVWDPPANGAFAYQIYYGTSSTDYTQTERVDGNLTTHQIFNLSAGTTYYFAIRAIDEATNSSPYSDEVSVDVVDSIAPPKVNDFVAKANYGSLIYGRLLSASSQFSDLFAAEHVADGSTESSWVSLPYVDHRDQELVIDLLKLQRIERLRLHPSSIYRDYFPQSIRVDLSADNTHWQTIAVKENLAIPNEALDLSFNATQARYLRLTITKTHTHPSGYHYASLAEIAVFRSSDSHHGMTLRFTAPGDDLGQGKADHYEIRYSDAPIDENNFSSAIQIASDLIPLSAGLSQEVNVFDLPPEKTLYFALVSIDEAGNRSALSNIATGTTLSVTPLSISDLSAENTASGVKLQFSAPADSQSQAAESYTVAYSFAPIDEATFSSATIYPQTLTPKSPGEKEELTIENLAENKLYYFAIKATDKNGYQSGISNSVFLIVKRGLDTISPAQITDLHLHSSLEKEKIELRIDSRSSELSSSLGASYLLDGNPYSAWFSQNGSTLEPEWVIFDLGKEELLSEVFMHPRKNSGQYMGSYPQNFSFEVSATKEAWQKIVTVEDWPAQMDHWDRFAFDPVFTRYLRLYVPQRRAGTSVVVVGEIESYKTKDEHSLTLTWSAPGDDGWLGQALAYECRLSKEPITDLTSFLAGDLIATESPEPGGYIEVLSLNSLDAESDYYVAIRAKDAAGNWGPLSNIGSVTTPGIPPSAITDLSFISSTKESISIQFSASGDDGTIGQATAYDLRYSLNPISEDNFNQATPVGNLPQPKLPGENEIIAISGLMHTTRYYIALKVEDEKGNRSLLSNSLEAETADGLAPFAVGDLSVGLIDASESQALTLKVLDTSGTYSQATTADNLFDGDSSTRYTSALRTSKQVESIHLDLLQLKRISRLRLRAATDDSDLLPGSFSLFIKKESQDLWKKVFVASDIQKNNEWQEWQLGSIEAKEIKIEFTNLSSWAGSYTTSIGDLEIYPDTTSYTGVRLSFSAPRDQPSGSVFSYDIRHASQSISESTFGQAIAISQSLSPKAPGELERLEVDQLNPDSHYCFALRSADQTGNISLTSNSACIDTPGLPPGAVNDLHLVASHAKSLDLSWSAPGDDGYIGQAAEYELRYSTSKITPDNFDQATLAKKLPIPALAGTIENYTLDGLYSDTLYYIALRSKDSSGNTSVLSNSLSANTSDGTAPDAVINLSAQTNLYQRGSILLSFSAPADGSTGRAANAYDLRYSLNPINKQNFDQATPIAMNAPKLPGSLENITLSNLAAETSYYFALKSSDSSGNISDLSNIASAQTRNEAPASINDLKIVAKSGGTTLTNAEFTIQWTAPADDGPIEKLSAYDIRISSSIITSYNFSLATKVDAPAPANPQTLQSLTIKGLAPRRLYYIAMIAIDSLGNQSLLSNQVSVLAPDAIAPDKTLDLSATASSSEDCLNFSFSDLGDNQGTHQVKNHFIRWSLQSIDQANFDQANLGAILAGSFVGTQRSFAICQLPAESEIYIALRSDDPAGNLSPLSNLLLARTADVAPSAIRDLSLMKRDKNALTLQFTASGDDRDQGQAQRYDLRLSEIPITLSNFTSATSISISAPQIAGTKEEVVINNLKENQRYYLSIKVIDDRGNESGLSNLLIASTLDQDSPDPIHDLSAKTGPIAKSIELNWTASGDDGSNGQATRYELRLNESPIDATNWSSATLYNAPPPQSAGKSEKTIISGLKGETRYYAAIKVIDDDGNISSISNIAQAETPAVAPAAISNLTASAEKDLLTLHWSAPGDDGNEGKASSYQIRYATSLTGLSTAQPIANAPLPAIAGTAQSVTISGLVESTTYYFSIHSVDDHDLLSPSSNIAQLTMPDLTAPAAPTNLVTIALADEGQELIPTQISASSNLGLSWSASNLVDDDTSTSWSSEGHDLISTDRILFDLGEEKSIDRVRLHPDVLFFKLFPKEFYLEASSDAQHWQVIRKIEGFNCEQAKWFEWGFKAITLRYLRIRVTGFALSQNQAYSIIAEAKIFSAKSESGSIQLSFIAPGDDINQGKASSYEIYQSQHAFNQSTLGQATQVDQTITPKSVGSLESIIIEGLAGEKTYYWGVIAIDEAGNRSALSTLVSGETNPVAPSPVDDLRATDISRNGLILHFTAPGDDQDRGQATSYELRYLKDRALSVESFPLAEQVLPSLTPSLSGAEESWSIENLEAGSVYYFALVAKDEADTPSYLSNILRIETLADPDQIAPSAVNDLTLTLPTPNDRPYIATLSAKSSEELPHFGADNIVDQENNTAWSVSPRLTPLTNDWLIIDLGQAKDIGQIDLYSLIGYEDLFPRAITLYASHDKLSWSQIAERQFSGSISSNKAQEFIFPTINARYIKIIISELAPEANGYFYGLIAEIKVYPPKLNLNDVYLSFTAVGDDYLVGKAAAYDLRYGVCPYQHEQSISYPLSTPLISGSPERFLISDLASGTHCFGLIVKDEAGNQSTVSNVAIVDIP